jgi:hypothetical protein
MPETKFDICSRALVRVGGAPITAFDTSSAEAVAAGQDYEPMVQARLSSHRWRFATAQEDLVRLTDTPAGDQWEHAFQLPAGLLLLHGITRAGRPVEYDRYGDKVFTNEDDGLVADYTFRADESRFPAYFATALMTELAHGFALNLARNRDLAATLAPMVNAEWQRARTADSQQQTTRRIRHSRLIAARR